MTSQSARQRLTDSTLSQFTDGQKVLLNPTEADVLSALATAQKSTRKGRLSAADALEALRKVTTAGFRSAHAGIASHCPAHFNYPIASTVIQVVRVTDGLICCCVGRRQVYPGCTGAPPITAELSDSPGLWVRQVMTEFWTVLDDEQIQLIRQQAVAVILERSAVDQVKLAGGHHGEHYGVRRRFQLDALLRRAQPAFVSELALAARKVAATLAEIPGARVDWRTFQQRWPSISTRYKREFLGVFRGGAVGCAELAALQPDSQKFSLGFTYWNGAQRIFPVPQVVFQVRSSLLAARVVNIPPGINDVVRSLRAQAQDSGHPVTRDTVGWLRVHIDDHDRLCFIDEVQSDVMESLMDWAPEQGRSSASVLARDLADWHTHGFSSVQDWAYAIGYRIAIHSQESIGQIEGRTRSERKWNVYYAALIKRFQLVRIAVPGYPAAIFVEP